MLKPTLPDMSKSEKAAFDSLFKGLPVAQWGTPEEAVAKLAGVFKKNKIALPFRRLAMFKQQLRNVEASSVPATLVGKGGLLPSEISNTGKARMDPVLGLAPDEPVVGSPVTDRGRPYEDLSSKSVRSKARFEMNNVGMAEAKAAQAALAETDAPKMDAALAEGKALGEAAKLAPVAEEAAKLAPVAEEAAKFGPGGFAAAAQKAAEAGGGFVEVAPKVVGGVAGFLGKISPWILAALAVKEIGGVALDATVGRSANAKQRTASDLMGMSQLAMERGDEQADMTMNKSLKRTLGVETTGVLRRQVDEIGRDAELQALLGGNEQLLAQLQQPVQEEMDDPSLIARALYAQVMGG